MTDNPGVTGQHGPGVHLDQAGWCECDCAACTELTTAGGYGMCICPECACGNDGSH